jgi:hypothetical protein
MVATLAAKFSPRWIRPPPNPPPWIAAVFAARPFGTLMFGRLDDILGFLGNNDSARRINISACYQAMRRSNRRAYAVTRRRSKGARAARSTVSPWLRSRAGLAIDGTAAFCRQCRLPLFPPPANLLGPLVPVLRPLVLVQLTSLHDLMFSKEAKDIDLYSC